MFFGRIIFFLDHHLHTKHLTEGACILDLGANDGRFAKEMNKHCGSNVCSIEASPLLAKDLPNNGAIKSYNYVISDTDGVMPFHLSDNSEASSIYQSDETSGEIVQVESKTLESILRELHLKPDVLKIDIEGAEIQMFNSTKDHILQSFKQVTVEFHDFIPEWNLKADTEKVKRRLEMLGFYCIKFSVRDNSNVLFIRKDQISWLEFLVIKHIIRNIDAVKRKMLSTFGLKQ